MTHRVRGAFARLFAIGVALVVVLGIARVVGLEEFTGF